MGLLLASVYQADYREAEWEIILREVDDNLPYIREPSAASMASVPGFSSRDWFATGAGQDGGVGSDDEGPKPNAVKTSPELKVEIEKFKERLLKIDDTLRIADIKLWSRTDHNAKVFRVPNSKAPYGTSVI